ncbi:Nitrate reductase 1 [Escovopsis weberi]|uniref:Nitrate reductase [NADPH] n=1 Tax=Escovopsis weberi TaxID=150374 RepID=A0A0M8N9C1_ESCWE|nr:Nitrate reductase 1 [Escovopsis weberi]
MEDKPWRVKVRDHPGSTAEEIANEPKWSSDHQHRIGYKNRHQRVPGITHEDDEYREEVERAKEEFERLKDEAKAGVLINFRDAIQHQKDLHLRHPENKSLGWRYVLNTTEDWVKNEEPWPANIERKRKRQQQQEEDHKAEEEKHQEEHEWRRPTDKEKHHEAYATTAHEDKSSKDEAVKYTPQELALLRAIQHENAYIHALKHNDGKKDSPQKRILTQISIDAQDQFTPDNWVPRSSDLIRLTGKHPLNAEAHLSHLFDAGIITPNELHYVRSHGAVYRTLWEYHQLDIEYNGKTKTLAMDDLLNYDAINIPIALACDGNRRKELNMIRKSKGFSWGPGGVSCAYWKGPLVRDVLLDAGVPETLPNQANQRYWVHFEGADEPSHGKYATSIAFDHVMNVQNDVMLAYEMNDVPLPPDHGYPVRLMIPGYVGGRCVKWLRRIWVSDKENDSYYHIWDNRVLPSFVTEKDGPFSQALFHHPDTACYEQNLNSVIVKPAHGEEIFLSDIHKGETYRIEGFAYDGGGHEVQRVEVSLDGGDTWLYCIRKFPDYPIRHGTKFWAWIFWHVDVTKSHLLRAKSITVRCFNVFKNTQPERPNWNIMGMLNNCWYVVRPEIVDREADQPDPAVLFRHPVQSGTGGLEGWMKPSVENMLASVKNEAGTSKKQFTRAEIEKHDKKDDCWIVVDGNVYDATSVLDWHPGGAEAILGHAGKVHQETSEEFATIHDDYAYQKLQECALGRVTDKAANFIKERAEAAAREKAAGMHAAGPGEDKIVLQKHHWVPAKLLSRKEISSDTRTYTFSLPGSRALLGLGTCQHVLVGFHLKDRMLVRPYTPTRPLLPHHHDEKDETFRHLEDGDGTFDLTVKTYFPNDSQPGGAMSNILDCIPLGEEVELRGPTGDIVYTGNGRFVIEGKPRTFRRVSLVLGGSGITPGFALIGRILLSRKHGGGADQTSIRVVDANNTQNDILLRAELDRFERESDGQLGVTHVLSKADESWTGLRGYVTEEIMKNSLFPPADDSIALLCGPPAMIQKAALPALRDWGYVEDVNMFGF